MPYWKFIENLHYGHNLVSKNNKFIQSLVDYRSDTMDYKKIFQPKIWFIIGGVMAIIGGIENNINAETWAKSAWGDDGATTQALALEHVFGAFMVAFGAMALVCAFVLEETSQAKFAVANASVMITFFLGLFALLGYAEYQVPGIEWLIPPFVFLGGLLASGIIHMNTDEVEATE